ncbi:MAG TPA: glycosyltransferase [Patescibacteria group bacterium]|nr:glycosyltransferase [Patescibacteria group bacterium]
MKISVAFLIGSFRYGGAERDLLELARRLDPARYDLHILYLERDGEMLPDIEATGVSMWHLQITDLLSASGLRAVGDARQYLRQHKVQILQGFGTYGSFYAAVIARGVPGLRVIAYEFTPVPPREIKARLFQPWYYHRADCIVGNSDAVLAAVAGRRGVAGKSMVKIYNGVDASKYVLPDAAELPSIPRLPPGVPVVASVGRLNPVKGHEYLVAAWPRVVARYPEARLLLIGPARPEDRQRIERAVRATGHEDRILLLGPRRDVPRLLGMVDVVALPSLTEGFSNVVIEAGAAGRPVVATRVGGNPEAIEEGVTGLLVPSRDPTALADALIELLGDPERRRRMGEAARRRVRELYSVERMIEGYDRLYVSLTRTSRTGA